MGQSISLGSYSSETSPLEAYQNSPDPSHVTGTAGTQNDPSWLESESSSYTYRIRGLYYENNNFSPANPEIAQTQDFYLKGDYYFAQRNENIGPSGEIVQRYTYNEVIGVNISVTPYYSSSITRGEQIININRSTTNNMYPDTPQDPNQEATFHFGDLSATNIAYGFNIQGGNYENNIRVTLNINEVNFDFGSIQAKQIYAFGINAINSTLSLSQSNISFGDINGGSSSSGITLYYNGSFYGKANINLDNSSTITFKSISGTNPYGILRISDSNPNLGLDFSLQNNSSIVFESIKDSKATGIYETSNTSQPTNYQIDSTSQILFKNIEATKQDAIGISAYEGVFNLTGGGNITFSNITSPLTASGIYLTGYQNTDFTFDANSTKSSLVFTKISGGLAEGIYIGSGSSIGFSGNGEILFTNIEGSKIAYGLHSESTDKINFYTFDDKAKMTFTKITGSIASYGIYNNGNAIYDFGSGGVSFDSIIGGKLRATGIYNHQGLMEISGSLTFTSISNSFGGIYGIQNNGDMILSDGSSITFGTPTNKNLTDYKIYEGLGSTLELGNMVLSSSKDTTTGIIAQDSTTMLLQANKTLNFDLRSDSKEGIAFSGGNLILSSQSQVVFNSNGGSLTSISGNDGKLLLSGTSKDNRLKQGSSLLLRSLEVNKFNLNNSSIVIYADKTATIDTTNGFDGRAYSDDKTHSAQGGSDRIIINGSTLYTPIYNTLQIALSNFDSATRNYVVLAEVDNSVKDIVIFNGLTQSREKSTIKSYAGFEEALLEIERYDGANKTYYFSHLASPNQAVINSDYSKSTISTTHSNFSLLSANLNSLNKRMGDLRADGRENSVWARAFVGSLSLDFDIGTQDKNEYWTLQAGYDYGFSLEGSTNYLGFALSYTNSNTTQNLYSLQYTQDVSNYVSTNGVELAIYNAYIAENGFYSDSILKASYLNSQLDFFNQSNRYDVSNYALTLSQEVGYRFAFGSSNEWIITPELEVAYSYLNSTDFTQTLPTNHTMQVHQNAISLLRNRVGLDWRYDFSYLSESVKASVYVGTYYMYDLLSGGEISLKTLNDFQTYEVLKSEGRMVLNVGTDMKIYEQTSLYFDFEKSFLGKQIQTNYQVNFGVRYGFGEKLRTPISEEIQEENKAPLKIETQEEDKKAQ